MANKKKHPQDKHQDHKEVSSANGETESQENHRPAEENPAEPVEIHAVDADDIEIIVDSDSENIDDESADGPRRPSSKEVLNRLLEKNEIILALNKDNADKDKQLKEITDKWLRSVAEFENYRKRTRKEWELLKQQSKAEVILEILNVVDDFERAFSVAEDENQDEFVQGIRLIYNNLVSVLDKFGIKEIVAFNSSFDPNLHMAIGQIETGDISSGFVAEVVQKGYKLDASIIRPARVIVAK